MDCKAESGGEGRFASHAAFTRRSCFRNLFAISSLSFRFPLGKNPEKFNGPSGGGSPFGSRKRRRIAYHQATEFDASAPSRWRSRACLALTSWRELLSGPA